MHNCILYVLLLLIRRKPVINKDLCTNIAWTYKTLFKSFTSKKKNLRIKVMFFWILSEISM